MKKVISIAVSVMFVTALFAGKGFVITQKYSHVQAKESNVKLTWYVTETQCKMKMEYSDPKVNTVTWFIPDIASGNLLTYSEGPVPAGVQKSYFAVPVEHIKGSANVSRVSVAQTAETKSLFGILCQQVIIKTNDGNTELWVTKDFKADFYKFSPYFQKSVELMGLNEEKIQGVPLASVTKDNSDKVVSSYDLISVSAVELSDDDFKVPSEYKSQEEISKGKN